MASMYRHYPVSGRVLPGPLILSLVGALFCAWSAWGNGLSLCVTSGCSLYQDFNVWGISLWWVGVLAFGVLALTALLGRPLLGHALSSIGLILDILLLLLLLLTAPCAACLIAGVLLALTYASFRVQAVGKSQYVGRSIPLIIWLMLFIINVGAVVRAGVDQFSMHGPEDAAVRMYFSPSCPSCREGVIALSGRINVAFYPVAEEESDPAAVAAMIKALEGGSNMAEAIKSVQTPPAKSPLGWLDMLGLRFRLLCNKAHVLAAGAQVVPFFEFHGLPNGILAPYKDSAKSAPSKSTLPKPQTPKSTDFSFPVDTGAISGCGKNQTCQ